MTSELGSDLGPEQVETVVIRAVSVASPYPWCSSATVEPILAWRGSSAWTWAAQSPTSRSVRPRATANW